MAIFHCWSLGYRANPVVLLSIYSCSGASFATQPSTIMTIAMAFNHKIPESWLDCLSARHLVQLDGGRTYLCCPRSRDHND